MFRSARIADTPAPFSFRRALSLLGAVAALSAVCVIALIAFGQVGSAAKNRAPKRVLVVTVTKGFHHDSIPVGEQVVQKLADDSRGAFTVDFARTDADLAQKMTPGALKSYDAAFFLNTTGDLPLPDRDAFIRWVKDGHALIGVHAAADTFHGFPAYIQLLGAEFKTHGPQVDVVCEVEDRKHPATKLLDETLAVRDEIYQFQNFDRARVHGLLTLNAHPNDKTPGDYPVAWTRRDNKGRVFYTSLGHRDDVWTAPWYQAHLLGGIRWALGLDKGDDKPQKK